MRVLNKTWPRVHLKRHNYKIYKTEKRKLSKWVYKCFKCKPDDACMYFQFTCTRILKGSVEAPKLKT